MGYYDRWREMIPTGHWAHNDPVLSAFYQALAEQADDLVVAIHAARSWLNPTSADVDGLTRWELLLGIGSEGDLETRRARVIARLTEHGTIRTEVLAAIAEAFGATVVIEEVPAQYLFRVHFRQPLGQPPYVDDLRAVYDEIKRATWQYEFAYTFNTWAAWSGKTWKQIMDADLTWLQMQSVDPVTIP